MGRDKKINSPIDLINLLTVIFTLVVLLIHQSNYVFDIVPNFFHPLLQINLPFLGSFTFAVAGFIFLSGYKLASSPQYSFVQFWQRRFFRIYPLYLLAVLLFALLINRHSTPANIILHLLSLQSLFPRLFGDNFLTLYFIGLLFLFYLDYSLTARLLSRPLIFLSVQLLIFGLSLGLHFANFFNLTLFDVTFFSYFWFFIIGIFSAHYFPLPRRVGSVPLWFSVLVNNLAIASYPVYLFHRVYWQIISNLIHGQPLLQWCLTVPIGFPLLFVVGLVIQKKYNHLVSSLSLVNGD